MWEILCTKGESMCPSYWRLLPIGKNCLIVNKLPNGDFWVKGVCGNTNSHFSAPFFYYRKKVHYTKGRQTVLIHKKKRGLVENDYMCLWP